VRTNEQTIVITLGADGSIQTEAKGVKGAACYDLTKQLEKALGTVAEDARTVEFGQKAEEKDSVRYAHNRR